MITETGRIVAIEDESLWVQTIRKSACAQCSARKGCGQAVLAQFGREPGYINVSLNGQHPSDYQLDQAVEIGIAEQVIVKSTLLIYLFPLLLMMIAIGLGSAMFEAEFMALISGIAGLGLGALIVRAFFAKSAGNQSLQPILIGRAG
ncbi:SoxR reducing system RseC family protein [Halioxenophilus aromaticivorans]|uniref:Alginate biosynthesis regulator MucC n=1 Tax=Halioxenophilus aromaticivorans TaxID=1306992 RepID=A0AAV3TXL0_9ALTE